MSKLPTDSRPVRVDPDMAALIEDLLKPYTGAKLERGQDAVREFVASGTTGSFGQLCEQLTSAVKQAVSA